MTDCEDILNDPIWYPYTSIPVLGPRKKIEKAKGSYIYTSDGEKVFDATSSWWCQIHGHSHPRIVKALQEQIETLDHVMLAPHQHAPASDLARELLEVMGEPYKKVFYSDNGSTAVEVAVKILLQYWKIKETEKKRFLSLENSYHGDTLGTIALSDSKVFHKNFKAEDSSYNAMTPYCYRCPLKKTYPSCDIECLGSVKEVLKNHHAEIAGAVIEPLVLGAGGMLAYPKEYLEGFTSLCHEYGVPVIFDEVFTGFGRTGTLFAYEQIKNRPDFICLSKGLTSGVLPLGVTVTTQEFFEPFTKENNTFYHGHTFTGNPLSCRVALESLRIFTEENVINRNKKLMDVLASQKERFLNHRKVGDVRHLGMIWAIELVEDKASKQIASVPNALGWKIAEQMWEKGFWVRPLYQILYLIPPYSSTPEELTSFFESLYSCLD